MLTDFSYQAGANAGKKYKMKVQEIKTQYQPKGNTLAHPANVARLRVDGKHRLHTQSCGGNSPVPPKKKSTKYS